MLRRNYQSSDLATEQPYVSLCLNKSVRMARRPKKQAKAPRRPIVGPLSAVSLPAAENWPVDRHVAYERKARTHSELQVAQIAASIAEFGCTNPVLIDHDGKIIAGHGQVLAARQLGLSEVPVLVLDCLSPAQRRAYMIVDNKFALNAGWDDELLVLRRLARLVPSQPWSEGRAAGCPAAGPAQRSRDAVNQIARQPNPASQTAGSRSTFTAVHGCIALYWRCSLCEE